MPVCLCLASLLERKELWRRQTEERLRNLPDPDTPPGHTMMPEGQRLETLGNLKQSKRKRKGDSSSEKQAILARIREKRVRGHRLLPLGELPGISTWLGCELCV